MTEHSPRREATRARLVDAAVEEFATRGIDATSVEQLCDRAGFTRGAFYSNFTSKDDLCIAVLEDHRERTMSGLDAVFQPPPDAGLDWVVDHALPTYFRTLGPTTKFRLTMLEMRLRATRSPELADRLRAFDAETRPAMVQFLERAANAVGLRLRLPADQLFDVFDALYFQPTAHPELDETLITRLLVALVEQPS